MSKRIKPWQDVKTFGDVKAYAEGRGAHVEKHTGKLWDKIEAPGGSIFISKNDSQEVDPQTKGNLKRWMRLVGLMIIVGFLLKTLIGF